jgi:predicted ATPase/class 3 adenylate cyclase
VRPELPTGTVTFLFTDVEGSTRLLNDLGSQDYARALAEHRKVVREACLAQGGVEVDTQGDAFFFAFPTAPGALSAASELTERLAAGGPIRVRVGLHTGSPLLGDEGYVGHDVHRAARVAAAGHGGQVLVSASTAPLVEAKLTDLGEHRLKDLGAPERIYQLGGGKFPALKSLYRTNLPVPTTPFLGRERELQEVVALLSEKDRRLLTLTGPGGSGKTRLAAQAAGLAADAYPDGVWWVPLAPLRDPGLVLETAAQAVGSKNGLAEHVADQSMLLLLDNFEQVVEASRDMASLLAACPRLDLLVTSRVPLHVTGEQEYPVPPLVHEEGVGFFLAKARAVRPDFQGDETVSEICRRLDDLPLALELAAARVKALSSTQLLERLDQALPLLTGGAHDLPERQRTLRATIEWSYDLLTDDEQRLFARLAVFRGGCTLEAAEQVADADLDTLQSLVDKSLLRHTGERFSMLETIRAYAWERLAASGEEPDLRRRHTHCALELAEATWRGILEDQAVVLARIDADLDNMRAALEWARDSRAEEVLLRLTAVLGFFWLRRGYYHEADTWIALALERASSPVTARMHVLRAASMRAASVRDYERSDAYVAEWRSLAEQAGDENELLRAMNSAALNAGEQGQFDTARAQFIEIESRAREIGDRMLVAFAAINLGEVAWRSRDFQAALDYAGNAVDLFRELRDDGGVITALGTCGWSSLGLHDPVHAEARFREALALAARLGWKRGVAHTAAGLAISQVALHEEERAAQLLGAASSLLEELGRGLESELEEEIHAQALADARAALGEEAFAAAWARGEGMTVDAIAAFAEGE